MRGLAIIALCTPGLAASRAAPPPPAAESQAAGAFGAGSSWLHGYARGTTPAAVKRMDIAFNARRDLPTGDSAGSATRRL